MADKKISQLTALTGANTANNDVLPIVDTSATETKKITLTELQSAPISAGTANGVAYLNGSKVLTTGSALTFDGTAFANTGSITANGYLWTTISGVGLSGTAASYGKLAVQTASNYNLLVGADSSAVGVGAYNNNATSAVQLNFNASPMVFNISGSEQMRLTSTGLGIGTTNTTAAKLNVVGASGNTNFAVAGGSYGVRIDNNTTLGLTGSVINGVDNTLTTTYQPLAINGSQLVFGTGGTEKMRLDSSGNLGLGVTPSAWYLGKALQVGSYSAIKDNISTGATELVSNGYYTSPGNWIYLNPWGATKYTQVNSQHQWYTAPSGTAGNPITFTQAMTLNASGNLAVVSTTPTPLNLTGAGGGCQINLNDGTQNANWGLGVGGAGITGIASPSTYPFVVYTNGSERMRIDSSGNVGIGTSSLNYRLDVYNGASNTYNASDMTASATARIYNQPSTSTAGLAIGSYNSYSSINSIHVATYSSALVFGTSNVASTGGAVERMRIDSSGNLLVGKTSATANGGVIQTSNGITFPATQSACSDANTLDDYEEGTWTPTLYGSTTAGTTGYTVASGTYTKVGNVVTCTIALNINSKTGTGSVSIGGLPFTSAGYNSGSPVFFTEFGSNQNNQYTLYWSSGSVAYIAARNLTSGAITYVSMTDIPSNFQCYGSFSYLT